MEEKELKKISLEIKKEIEKANKIVILSHENPDGDAIGSMLAIYQYIKDEYNDKKDIEVIAKDLQNAFSFLKGFDEIKFEPTYEVYDLCICLDLHKKDRLR